MWVIFSVLFAIEILLFVADVRADEAVFLMSIPAPFDGYIEHSKRGSSTCLVTFDNNRYSVLAYFANRPISLHVYAHSLVMIAEGKVFAAHPRVFTRDHTQKGNTIYSWRHFLSAAQCQ